MDMISSDSLVWSEPLDILEYDTNPLAGNGLLRRVGQSTGGALTSAREKAGNLIQTFNTHCTPKCHTDRLNCHDRLGWSGTGAGTGA